MKIWLVKMHDGELHHMQASEDVEKLKQWVIDEFDGTFKFIKPKVGNLVFIHCKGREVGIIGQIGVV